MDSIKAIKTSFSVLWKNSILVTPLILFMLVGSIMMGTIVTSANGSMRAVLYLLLFLLCVAFLAGWLYMTKKTIAFHLYEAQNIASADERAKTSLKQIKHFLPGVGEYFLPMVGLGLVYYLGSALFGLLVMNLGAKVIGIPAVDAKALETAAASVTQLQAFISTLPVEELQKIAVWMIYILTVSMLSVVFIWWVPALFYNTKNPFKALLIGLKFFFKKFLPSIGIFLYLTVLAIIVNFISALFESNFVLSLVGLLLFFFYATYYVVLIFLYYGQNGEHTAKDYINSGDDSDGQKLAGSESGEEN